jgi:hypothetical protein
MYTSSHPVLIPHPLTDLCDVVTQLSSRSLKMPRRRWTVAAENATSFEQRAVFSSSALQTRKPSSLALFGLVSLARVNAAYKLSLHCGGISDDGSAV